MIRIALILACLTFGRQAPGQAKPGPPVYQEDFDAFRQRGAVQRKIAPAEHSYWRDWLGAALHQATNAARVQRGLAPLQRAAVLDSAAGHYARLLRQRGALSHRSPQPPWRRPSDRIAYWGGDYRQVAENLARYALWDLGAGGRYRVNSEGKYSLPSGQPVQNQSYLELAQNVVQDWLESPGHRANLLGPYTDLGLGVARWKSPGKPPKLIIVQNFGKP